MFPSRSLTQFTGDTPRPLIGPLQHSTADHMYLRHNDNYPPSSQMEPSYNYPHSNPYPMLPREHTFHIGHQIDSHQPLVFQSGNNDLDSIDTVPYKQSKKAPSPDFEYINTGLVKNKPTNTFFHKYQQRFPNSICVQSRSHHKHNNLIGLNSIQNDPNLTNEKQYSELNEITHQNTKIYFRV